MRLWSLHPQYLDPQGLVALWREALLARAVLKLETRGYRHHPQLIRFQAHPEPIQAIEGYLYAVFQEAVSRGFSFDAKKVAAPRVPVSLITVSDGQMAYEWTHLMAKLARRSPAVHQRWIGLETPDPHPLFTVTPGPVAEWERV